MALGISARAGKCGLLHKLSVNKVEIKRPKVALIAKASENLAEILRRRLRQTERLHRGAGT